MSTTATMDPTAPDAPYAELVASLADGADRGFQDVLVVLAAVGKTVTDLEADIAAALGENLQPAATG